MTPDPLHPFLPARPEHKWEAMTEYAAETKETLLLGHAMPHLLSASLPFRTLSKPMHVKML